MFRRWPNHFEGSPVEVDELLGEDLVTWDPYMRKFVTTETTHQHLAILKDERMELDEQRKEKSVGRYKESRTAKLCKEIGRQVGQALLTLMPLCLIFLTITRRLGSRCERWLRSPLRPL